MDLMSVAVRFTAAGQAELKAATAQIRKDAAVTGTTITQAIQPSNAEFKNLARSVNEVGNQMGLGLNRGLAQAGRGLSDAANAASQYITQMRSSAAATSLLSQAQMVLKGTTQALSGVLSAFGGIVGVTLIGAVVAYQKLTDSWAESVKEVEDAYERVKVSTQKVYEQLVQQSIGWNNAARSIQNAKDQLEAYRKGGARSLEREKDWQEAISRTRAQLKTTINDIEKYSDAVLMQEPIFAQAFQRHAEAIQSERDLANAITATREAEELRQRAMKASEDIQGALYQSHKAITAQMQTLTLGAIEEQGRAERNAAAMSVRIKQEEVAQRQEIEANFQKWADRVWQEELQRRKQLQLQIASGLAGAVQAAFSAAFAGKNPLEALTSSILQGLGQILIQLGTTALAAAPFVAAIRAALTTLSGGALAAAGIGLIGVGSALGALGASIGGGTGIGGGGFFGQGRPQDIYRQISFQPTAVPAAAGITNAPPMHITIIGPSDPTAQRQMQELIRNANRRGNV